MNTINSRQRYEKGQRISGNDKKSEKCAHYFGCYGNINKCIILISWYIGQTIILHMYISKWLCYQPYGAYKSPKQCTKYAIIVKKG